ncbi:FKBP-type peptidyl-prolyl cis-trans isomerase [Cardinium endosymbiont of Nabis limbatus]|uniref:FKBP-type peptidyl-prolyl cis-trans isomerase n=1 Tax=Cardinium endosymbiont of Nabis limbatus TaxID=3066217 RepID=UPI003AF3D1A2
MKMKRKVVCAWILLVLVMGLVWYNHQYHSYGYPFLTTPSGLSYKSIGHKGNGRKVKDGEWVQLTLVTKVITKVEAQDPQSSPEAAEVDKQETPKATAQDAQSSPEEGAADQQGSSKVAAQDAQSSPEAEKADKQETPKATAQDAQSSPKAAEAGTQSSPKQVKKYKFEARILINAQIPTFFRFDQSFQANNMSIPEMIGMMKEGQRMVFKCRPEYFLQEKDPERLEQFLKQLNLNKEDEVVTDIKLDKIMTDASYQEMLAADRATQLAKDKKLITDYLAAHHIEATSTDSGLFYIIDQSSEGIPVAKGKTVKVHYTGRLLDGTVFDTSVEEIAKANGCYDARRTYQPFEFQVGSGQVIQGWDEGLLLLKQHEKARFFIPSALAYGPQGRENKIPKNAILIFEVEVVDVI